MVNPFSKNHPNPRCFLFWVLDEVESIKNKLVKEVGLHNSIHSRLDELERELVSFISFMDELVDIEELKQ
tara:strand:- start:916 stop:1125 length:210 start_codon:yes stop_codon:yes gene_type:complete